MAAELDRRPLAVGARSVSPARRVYGYGSVFGKTIRDARLGLVAVAALLGVIILAGGGTMATTYGTAETRVELAMLSSSLPPVLTGLYGNPVKVDTLGGFIAWHYGAYFALLVGLWSIMALSSTLAGEARRGSLDFVLATRLSRRRVALEKVAGHLAAIVIAMAIIGILTWITGAVFARLPGDAIAPGAAAAFAFGLGVKALVAGALAFGLAPFVGRGAAAGLAGAAMVAGYVLNSYRTVVPAFDAVAGATWFSWTGNHIPLAGRTDWPSIAFTGLVAIALLVVGTEAFARRDVGGSTGIRLPWFPAALLGIRGPVGRTFGEHLPAGLAWGIGLGVYAFVMAAASRAFAESVAATPEFAAAVRNLVPGVDMTTAAGFLEMAFVDFGFVLAGLAAATLVAGRSSDETGGRLELLLATPLTRGRWSIASAIGIFGASLVAMALLAAGIAAGVAVSGSDPLEPALGTIALALYAAALIGVGVAVGGLSRPSFAGPAVLVVAIVTFLVDVIAPALNLPDWVHQLALTAHVGKPIIGAWDAAGMAAFVTIAIAGVAIGTWGIRRRDVGG